MAEAFPVAALAAVAAELSKTDTLLSQLERSYSARQTPSAALDSFSSPSNTQGKFNILVTQRNYYGREHA